ncbi:hypothetical protein N7474_009921 [Penicillium riverlandense]|uniref:uncharacterized protein n=1 Tax=Penicillium riverlandense TaxID=1903569 RepID=UPI002546FFDD|nr:uncharacterized protein N7474_009921 [Penicillium riverlandense]KAJ5808652.1 hypothetical protein N7474_009921 [Penicillium riverlandense]
MANPGTISTRMSKTVQAFAPIASALSSRKDKTQPAEGDINLADGENTLMKTEMVGICQEAIQKSITAETFANPDGFNSDPVMREALAKYITMYFHPAIPVTPENIVPSAGSGHALDALLFTICDAGDSVLCPAPAWWGYQTWASIHANVTVIPAYIDSPSPSSTWPTASLSKAIIPALEEAYASAPDPSRIKALLTSNPNNPFMRCWPRDVLRGMTEFCQKYGLHYVSDEVFANTVFDEADAFVSALELVRGDDGDNGNGSIDRNLVHVVWSTTKDFGACGVRSGCAVSYNPLVKSGVSYATLWQVSSLTVHFTSYLLNSPSLPNLISSTRKQLAQSYKICVETLSSLEADGRVEILPATAGLWVNVIVNLRDGETTQDVVARAKKYRVAVFSQTAFARFLGKNQGLIVITFALEADVVRAGVERLRDSLL